MVEAPFTVHAGQGRQAARTHQPRFHGVGRHLQQRRLLRHQLRHLLLLQAQAHRPRLQHVPRQVAHPQERPCSHAQEEEEERVAHMQTRHAWLQTQGGELARWGTPKAAEPLCAHRHRLPAAHRQHIEENLSQGALTGCKQRVHSQGALTGCKHRVQAEGASRGCTLRVQAQGASRGRTYRVQAQGASRGCKQRVQAQGASRASGACRTCKRVLSQRTDSVGVHAMATS